MKRLFIALALLLLCILITEESFCQWSNAQYFPESGYALTTTTGSRVYAGCYKFGVFLSTDNGMNWWQTSLVPANGNDSIMINALAANGNYIYAGENGWVMGVHLSTDYGATWSMPMTADAVISLAVTGSTVYAGGYDNGVYRSTNNGLNWTQTSLTGNCINALSISGNDIYAGTIYNGVYISTNAGVSWTKTSLGDKYVWSVTTSGTKVYAGSTNGTNWVFHNDGFQNNIALIHSVILMNNYLIVGTDGWGIYRRPMLEVIGIRNVSTEIPAKYYLGQNYPNPFNPSTDIRFQIPLSGEVSLKVYDISGKEVEVLVNDKLEAGEYIVRFDAGQYGSLASGVYFYRLQAGDFSDTRKLILLK